jgi:hypothetical protein
MTSYDAQGFDTLTQARADASSFVPIPVACSTEAELNAIREAGRLLRARRAAICRVADSLERRDVRTMVTDDLISASLKRCSLTLMGAAVEHLGQAASTEKERQAISDVLWRSNHALYSCFMLAGSTNTKADGDEDVVNPFSSERYRMENMAEAADLTRTAAKMLITNLHKYRDTTQVHPRVELLEKWTSWILKLPDDALATLAVEQEFFDSPNEDHEDYITTDRFEVLPPTNSLAEALELVSREIDRMSKALDEEMDDPDVNAAFRAESYAPVDELMANANAESKGNLNGRSDAWELFEIWPFTNALRLDVILAANEREQLIKEQLDVFFCSRLHIRTVCAGFIEPLFDQPDQRSLLAEMIESPWGFAKRSAQDPQAKQFMRVHKPLLALLKATGPRPLNSRQLAALLRASGAPKESVALAFGDHIASLATPDNPERMRIYLSAFTNGAFLAFFAFARHVENFLPVLHTPIIGLDVRTPQKLEAPEPLRESPPIRQAPPTPRKHSKTRPPQGGKGGKTQTTPSHVRPSRDAIPATCTISYVLNPTSRTPSLDTLSTTNANLQNDLIDLVAKHARATEPAASLVRAIIQFAFIMPAEHRQVWSKERVGTFTFHKLKRGTDRIWIRVTNGDIIFHIFQRKDWSKTHPFA